MQTRGRSLRVLSHALGEEQSRMLFQYFVRFRGKQATHLSNKSFVLHQRVRLLGQDQSTKHPIYVFVTNIYPDGTLRVQEFGKISVRMWDHLPASNLRPLFPRLTRALKIRWAQRCEIVGGAEVVSALWRKFKDACRAKRNKFKQSAVGKNFLFIVIL
jgi:hypothetical protein